jgi:hypothetical protein
MAELGHYCRIIGRKCPAMNAVGAKLSKLGYTSERVTIDGRKMRVYRFELRLADTGWLTRKETA